MEMNPFQKSWSIFTSFFLLVLFLLPAQGMAQMFSVRQAGPDLNSIPLNTLTIGLEPASMDYEGGPNELNAGIYEFEGSLVRIRYDNPFVDLFIGFGGDITGVDEVSYFDAGLRLRRGIRLVRNRQVSVLVPLQLKSAITSVGNEQQIGGTPQFEQGAITLGGGAELRVRAGNGFRFRLNAVPNYGFSFATGGTFGGSMFDLELGAKIYLDRVFGNFGLVAGWDYNLRKFDVDEDQFDYDFQGNTISVGVTF